MKNLRDLVKENSKVYIYLANDELGNRFMKQADAEGFTFGDGVSPTQREYANVMAINPDGTINYVGAYGRVAFGSGIAKIGSADLVRVDYAKFASGEEDYYYKQ